MKKKFTNLLKKSCDRHANGSCIHRQLRRSRTLKKATETLKQQKKTFLVQT
jgi:hypothetical protein